MVERHLVWPRHGSAFHILRAERGSPFVSYRNDPNREPLRKLDGGEIDDQGNRPVGDPVA